MAFSIRTRLTFWYVTLLTVSLIGFGVAFSYSLFKIFMYRVDNQITSVANMMVHTVLKPTGQIFLPNDFDIILERFFGIRTSGNYIQVLDAHGTVLAKSSNLENTTLPISQDTYHAALKGLTSYEVVSIAGKYPMRVITLPVILNQKGMVAIIQVGDSLEGVQEVFQSLFSIYIPAIILAVITASAVGWFLARKALKPVAEITDMARRIGAENLNERLNIAVPLDEIGRLASTINEMIERLEKSFKQIKQFTADASHELKTPLTILKGEMEIALRGKGEPVHLKEALRSSLEEIDRMNYIVRNLLDLAKMDVEREALPREKVSLDRALTERFEHFRRLALDSGVHLAILRNRHLVVYGDQVRIGQLLFNLIDNAVKYTPNGGHVELSLDEEDGKAVVRVKDTGVGISAEDLPYIFDRFYRVDKARTRDVGGAGLGLSICKEIAESHGGTLEAASEAGKGSTFTVRLPLADAAGPA
ncbi:MAG: HAMP domain-containing protein [Deltaproteobacteria bacterium]|nr:HAMP domain-containing protein [Deltaproteobacteria bacterium]